MWRRTDDDTPLGINVGVGATAILVAGLLASRIPGVDTGGRCALMALAVGGFAALTVDVPAVGLLVPATWMIMDGFLVNRFGDLTWHDPADAYRVAALATAGLAGLAAGAVMRRFRAVRGGSGPSKDAGARVRA